jgi:hypothetical protein
MSGAKFVEETGFGTVRGAMVWPIRIGRSPGGVATASTRGGGPTITVLGSKTGAAGGVRVSVTAVSIVADRFKLGITCSSITY